MNSWNRELVKAINMFLHFYIFRLIEGQGKKLLNLTRASEDRRLISLWDQNKGWVNTQRLSFDLDNMKGYIVYTTSLILTAFKLCWSMKNSKWTFSKHFDFAISILILQNLGQILIGIPIGVSEHLLCFTHWLL